MAKYNTIMTPSFTHNLPHGTLDTDALKKTGPLCFTACNFRSIDRIGTNFAHMNVILLLM